MIRSLLHLSDLLAGPGPSGSAGPVRRCQDCFRRFLRLQDRAVLSFYALLRQDTGGLLPSRTVKHASQRAQALVEFGLTIGLLMLVVVLTAQAAIYLHYRSSLDTAAREGAFQAALSGHSLQDGERAAADLWAGLEPGARPVTVHASQSGNLIVVTAQGRASILLAGSLPVSVRAVHSIERFQS